MAKSKIIFFGVVLLLMLGAAGIGQIAKLARGQQSPVPTPSYPVHPDDQHWVDQLQELPFSPVPYEGAPILRPDPTIVSMSQAERQQLAETLRQSTTLVYVSGPETAGSKITVVGKEIQLPPDIYVKAYIEEVMCDPIPDLHCPETPIYGLYTLKEDAHVRVEANGDVYTFSRDTEAEIEQDRNTFQFVLDALDTELKIDPYKSESSQ